MEHFLCSQHHFHRHVHVIRRYSGERSLLCRRPYSLTSSQPSGGGCYSVLVSIRTLHLNNKIIIELGNIVSYKIACAPSEDSDQTARMRSLIRVFAVRLNTLWILDYPSSFVRRL